MPKRNRWPSRLYALALPLVHRRAMRECGVLRVLQFTGVIPALIARALHGIPFVVTYGYDYAEVARLAGSRWKPRLLRGLERVALPRAAAVIVTSREMEERLARHPARPRLAYFPNGVDVDEFSPATRPSSDRGIRRVLYAGRLESEKNVERLIDAMALVRAPAARLVVVGDGRRREALAERAHRAGVGSSGPASWRTGGCRNSSAAPTASSFPRSRRAIRRRLIEAMACGVPCAASARGGIPSMVEHEATGLLFDPEDVDTIARAIERLLGDAALAARLGLAGRAAAVARYDARALLAAEAAFVHSLARPLAGRAAPSPRDLADEYAVAVPMDARCPTSSPSASVASPRARRAPFSISAPATGAISRCSRRCSPRARWSSGAS